MMTRRSQGKVAIILFAIMAVFSVHVVNAASLDVVQALDVITNTVDKLCYTVNTRGEAHSNAVKGEVHAQVDGLAKYLANIGVTGSADINNERYEGVLREHLAGTLHDNIKCRRIVFFALKDTLLPPQPVDARPSPEAAMSQQEAIAFAYGFILRETASVSEMAQYVKNRYAASVLYFNKGYLGPDMIIKDKTDYIRKWPTRSYKILPGSVTAQCINNECVVDGRLRYHVWGNKEICGVASFTLGLDFSTHSPIVTREQGQATGERCS
jgi:hypothetical protein